MLVLTRKLNQSIVIGSPSSEELPLEVTVLEVRGDQVRLGIKAPHNVAVHRKEVYLQIQKENEAASRTPAVGSSVGEALDQVRRK